MRKSCVIVALLCATVMAAPAQAYELFKGPVGLINNVQDKTYQGFTLVTPMSSTLSYLVDMKGNLVHQWKSDYVGMYAELLPNGNLLRHSRMDNPPTDFGGECGILEEFDWSGKKVWEFKLFTDKAMTHHAFDRMPNGNTLVLGWEYKSVEEAAAKGRDLKNPASLLTNDGVRSVANPKQMVKGIWPDFLMEVNKEGKVIWEWHVWDHIGTGADQFDINYVLPYKLNPMYAGPDWTHFNSVRYNEKTDQILLNSRHFGEFYIIDHKTGKMQYRWGNPSSHGKGKKPGGYADDGDQIMFGPHDAAWLPNGNISVFDNGTERPSGNYSRVIEMDPKTGKIVWEYSAKMAKLVPNSFYSSYQSAAQKLPNNNYLVTSTFHGHVFEVTPEKNVVWEFVNPMIGTKTYCSVNDAPIALQVHRAYRYAADFPGLKGKDLTAKGQINPGCPNWANLLMQNNFEPMQQQRPPAAAKK